MFLFFTFTFFTTTFLTTSQGWSSFQLLFFNKRVYWWHSSIRLEDQKVDVFSGWYQLRIRKKYFLFYCEFLKLFFSQTGSKMSPAHTRATRRAFTWPISSGLPAESAWKKLFRSTSWLTSSGCGWTTKWSRFRWNFRFPPGFNETAQSYFLIEIISLQASLPVFGWSWHLNLILNQST